MWIFPLLGYAGVILGFAFLTLAIASGLYYLSELVEEHTVLSKKVLTRLIQSIIAVHVLLLLFDGFPVLLTIFSAASHGVYLANVRQSFPYVRLGDPVFLLSCFLVIANHFLWFRHFSNPPPIALTSSHKYASNNDLRYNYYYTPPDHRFPTFTEISAFFGICVWLVPFALFVSLSASDNVLPTMGAGDIGGGGGVGVASGSMGGIGGGGGAAGEKRKGEGLAKAMFGGVKEWMVESGEALGIGQAARRRDRF